MNQFTPFVKQIIVASSSQLAGLSVGGVIGYPNVLLEQFRANDSTIHLDLETATWIGSIHGLAGIPSVFMPVLMQWKGRKIVSIASCLILCTAWIITYFSQSLTSILVAESLHGLGTNSIIVVSFYTISEMIDPRYRLISMSFYIINETLGISAVGILGRYLHWKTIAIIMSIPIIIALFIGCISPESPSWLAYTGKFEECKKSFLWLRGSDERSCKELNILINAQRGQKYRDHTNKRVWRDIKYKITSRDFYLPCFNTFVCLSLFYNSGSIVLITYGMDIIRKTTKNESAAFFGMISFNVILFVGSFLTVFLLKQFKNKPVLLLSGLGSFTFLLCASITTLLQYVNVLPKDSLIVLYCLICYKIVDSLGISTMCFTVAAELMPVKHRDLGGSFYVILTSLMHFISLKVSPYLFLHLEIWGTLLIFSLNALCCLLYIWKYVPETKNRTLQEIEEFYGIGHFVDRVISSDDDVNTKIMFKE